MAKYLLLFNLLFSVSLFSQATIANPLNTTNENLKSPQVHLLKQFADHPVDLSRGLVDVSIPIYEIIFGNKTLPLKIMFHSSGLKADALENGVMGLKWALNVGGFISREVRGYPDEFRGHKQGIGVGYTPDWMTLYGGSNDQGFFKNNIVFRDNLGYIGYPEGTQGKYEDTEYDIYTFSLPGGESGKFLLKDNNGDKSASFMPYKPFKLNNPTSESFSSELYGSVQSFTKFELTDDEGYTYAFGKSDTNQYNSEQDLNGNYVNNWLLTSIVSPNKKDTIKFDYNTFVINCNSQYSPLIINDQLELDYFGNYYEANQCPQYGLFRNAPLFDALEEQLNRPGGYFQTNYNMPPSFNKWTHYLSKISFNDTRIDFTYKQVAEDVNRLLLDKIEISKANTIIKRIGFDVLNNGDIVNGYGTPSFLNSVNFLGVNNELIEKYSFDYYNLDKLPRVDKLANSADYWGYYNSQVSNVVLKDTVDVFYLPPTCGSHIQQRLSREIGDDCNRFSNSEDMKIGMLKSIIYPTGGKTTFNYEANQFKYNDTIRECGGLRIKSLITEDANGKNLKTREFTYGYTEDGTGQIPFYLNPYISPFRNNFEELATTYYIEDTEPHYDGGTGTYFWAQDTGEATYKTRTFSCFFPGYYYTFLNNLVGYDKVTEYIGDVNKNIGKIENYYYTNIPLNDNYVFNYTYNFRYQKEKFVIDPSSFWQGNYLTDKIEYKIKNGVYSPVKETLYSYVPNIIDEIYDLSIFRFKNFVDFDLRTGDQTIATASVELNRIKENPGGFFGYKLQKYTIGVENLVSVTEKLFFDNENIVQTTTNIYDANKPTFLKESLVINSKGKNLSQKYLYPFNVNTGVYSDMTTANVISPVVEKVSLNDTNVTGSTLITYKKSDANFVPDKNYVTELMNPIAYSGFSMFNGTTKDSHYSSYAEITYDSYDDFGNPTQLTSKGGVVTSFIWGYDKKYPVAKIENVSYATIPSALLTAIETASSSSGTEANLITALNNLRNDSALANAMVTTYTYKPLIGMSSMTDPKGYITYYEYDSYGRLQQVKDKDNNILSKNEYHYKN